MPSDPRQPDQAIFRPLGPRTLNRPRVLLVTSRGPRRSIGEILADVTAATEQGMDCDSAEPINLNTLLPPGSIFQIYVAETPPLPNRQPPRPV